MLVVDDVVVVVVVLEVVVVGSSVVVELVVDVVVDVLVVDVVVGACVVVVVVVGTSGPTTWSVYALLTVVLPASVASTVNGKSPLTVGVPDNTPSDVIPVAASR